MNRTLHYHITDNMLTHIPAANSTAADRALPSSAPDASAADRAAANTPFPSCTPGTSASGRRLPCTIQDFLIRQGYSSQVIKELKKMPESVLIDGRWEYMRHPLSAGETLTIRIQEESSSEKIPPVEMPLNIVYEDEDIMVINKPAGMPIHPSLNNYYNSLANGLAWYFEKQEKPFIFRCVNRLDKDTSGLTIIAKHMLSAGILSSMVSRREIRREYLAIVRGHIQPEAGTVDAPIARTGDSIIERCVDFEKGERAVTHYRLQEYKNGHSLLSIHLETGRTHQIRVHMKYMGYPLIGDSLYNPAFSYLKNAEAELSADRKQSAAGTPPTITRQALHSHRLAFLHPITREAMEFVAPLPEDMGQFFHDSPATACRMH